jgi:hypothetical protein
MDIKQTKMNFAENIFKNKYGNTKRLFIRDIFLETIILNPKHWNFYKHDNNNVAILKESGYKVIETCNIVDGSKGGLVIAKSHKEIGGIPLIVFVEVEGGAKIMCVGNIEGYEYILPPKSYNKETFDKFNESINEDFRPYEVPKETRIINAEGNTLILVPTGDFAIINKRATFKYLKQIDEFNKSFL